MQFSNFKLWEGGHEYGVQLGVNNSCSHECKVSLYALLQEFYLLRSWSLKAHEEEWMGYRGVEELFVTSVEL